MTASTTAARAEARASERFPCDVPASCRPPSDWRRGGMSWPAYLRNISNGGMRLVLARRFEPGAALAVEVAGTEDDDSTSTLLARVVHVQQHRQGAWALGCSLVSALSDEEIQTLTRPETLTDVTVRAAAPGGAVVERLIHRLNGAGRWPLRPGRKIGLRLHRPNGGPLVKVRVNACRVEDGRRILECAFLDARSAAAGL